MIAMQNMINKNALRERLQVTCNTCHRGSQRPVAVPPVLESDAPAPASATAAPPAGGAQAATVDQILEKYGAAAPPRAPPPLAPPAVGARAAPGDQILENCAAPAGGADAIHKVTSRAMK